MCHQLFLLFKLKCVIIYANMVENNDTTKNFLLPSRKAVMRIQLEETGRSGSFFVKEGMELVADLTNCLADPNIMTDQTYSSCRDAQRQKPE